MAVWRISRELPCVPPKCRADLECYAILRRRLPPYEWSKRVSERPPRMEIVSGCSGQHGFLPLRRCWVIECTFAWLDNFLRESKGCQFRTAPSESFTFIAASRIVLSRLAHRDFRCTLSVP